MFEKCIKVYSQRCHSGDRPLGQKTSPSNADTCVSLWDRRLVLILPRYCHAANEAFHSLSTKAVTTAQARAEKQVQLKDAPLAQEAKLAQAEVEQRV